MGLLQALKLILHALTEADTVTLAQKFIHAGLDLLNHKVKVTDEKVEHLEGLAERLAKRSTLLNAHATHLADLVDAIQLPAALNRGTK